MQRRISSFSIVWTSPECEKKEIKNKLLKLTAWWALDSKESIICLTVKAARLNTWKLLLLLLLFNYNFISNI